MTVSHRGPGLVLLAIVALGGCDDHIFLPSHGGGAAPTAATPTGGTTPTGSTTPPTGDDFCAVQAIINANCLACHGASALGGLELQTDPHAAIVGVTATIDPTWTLVVPGDPDASLLLQKIAGTQPAGAGTEMPPGSGLDADLVAIVRTWIEDGATDLCANPDTGAPVVTGYHPDGFEDASVHGQEAKLQVQACGDCHGADLTGGAGPSCDSCHTAGWRTNCTFCHGGDFDETGAPPRHISGIDDGLDATFVPHLAHTVDTDLHLAFPCETCHIRPTDVLSTGHLFVADATKGRTEVTFGGLGVGAAWDGNGGCSNLYCHGTGRAPGSMDHLGTVSTCHDCHPDLTSSDDAWGRMSGDHEDHLDEDFRCEDCHGATTADSTSILDPAVHVDGTVNVLMPDGITFNGTTCTGACHREGHGGRTW
ncbi:MAG: hypothetical protein ACI8PZ_001321 [Myxococcota bacterium]|jgi:hypothetical protein